MTNKQAGLTGMWCKHCRKDDHKSEDCWSTHAIPLHISQGFHPHQVRAYAQAMKHRWDVAVFKGGFPPVGHIDTTPKPLLIAPKQIADHGNHHAGPSALDELSKRRSFYVRSDGSNVNDGLAFTKERALRSFKTAVGLAIPFVEDGWHVTLVIGSLESNEITFPKYDTTKKGALYIRVIGATK